MKKIILAILAGAAITACSTDTPSQQKLSQNVLTVPSTTVVQVVSENNFTLPDSGENVTQVGIFKVADNVYDTTGTNVLIKKDSIVEGVYSNNSAECKISWNNVYANYGKYRDKKGSDMLKNVAADTVCSPTEELQVGDKITIKFK